MTFRTRILIACLAVAAIPLMILAAGARHVVREHLLTQYSARVAESGVAVRSEIARNASAIDLRLRALARRLVEDPVTRAAAAAGGTTAALLDFAPAALEFSGLDYLQLIDEDGTLLSSGHFRNDYGRALPDLVPALHAAAGPAVTAARRPSGEFLSLVRMRQFEIAGRRLALIGGIEIDTSFISRLAGGSAELSLSLDYPGGVLRSGDSRATGRIGSAGGQDATDGAAGSSGDQVTIVGRITLPFVAADGSATDPMVVTSDGAPAPDVTPGMPDRGSAPDAATAVWTIAHSTAPLNATVQRVDRWLLIAVGAVLLLAYAAASIVAARVTRPLEQLSRDASRVELTRYDIRLGTRRTDEIGLLSRLLDRMVQRLRTSAQQLRDVERRAAVGDMARQVNHDIRNGLLPIRNVIRHLTEVAAESPSDLAPIFAERAGTLQGGIGYLENLAANYARLTPQTERQPCDVNALIGDLLRDPVAVGADARVSLELGRDLPRAWADPTALRRVIENVVINAVESLDGTRGHVIVRTAAERTAEGLRVVITVADTGTGIEPAALDRIFDDFYTTKVRGTGLGLSIVRRLVADMGGRIQVESEPGTGTAVVVVLDAEGAG